MPFDELAPIRIGGIRIDVILRMKISLRAPKCPQGEREKGFGE
jgi:hypothetical protein